MALIKGLQAAYVQLYNAALQSTRFGIQTQPQCPRMFTIVELGSTGVVLCSLASGLEEPDHDLEDQVTFEN